MPLRECPDCMRQISDAAPACPHCGHPFVGHDDLLSPEAVVAFGRTILGATFRPRAFLDRSLVEPHRYMKPKRVLLTLAFLSAITISINFWLHPTTLSSTAQKVTGAAASIALPWISVFAFHAGARFLAGGIAWREATRLGGFKAAVSLFFTPFIFALTFVAKRVDVSSVSIYVPNAIISFAYGTFAFRSLGLGRGRAFGAAVVVWIVQMLLVILLVVGLGVSFIVLARWVPELRSVETATSASVSASSSAPPPPPPALSSVPSASAATAATASAPPEASSAPPVTKPPKKRPRRR